MIEPPPVIDTSPDVSREALQALRGDFLYFNVAGSGPTFPVAQGAAERYRTWLNEVGMFSHVGYDAYNAALAETSEDLAAFIGDAGGGARVALTQSATDALNLIIAALPSGALVTTAEEHASALLPLFRRKHAGDRLAVIPHVDDGSFLEALETELARGASALVLSLVSCKTGKLLPVARACAMARSAGALSVVDAAQATGQVPVDVRALGADAVVVLGHKWLHGPLATGALWVADPARFDPPRLGWRSQVAHDYDGSVTLHEDARRFETGTVDVAAYVGLRQALAVQRALGETVGRRVRSLRARLLERLRGLPFGLLSRNEDPTGIVVVAPTSRDAAGIVTRMWTDERIVVKHIDDPGMPQAIRLSFWALHDEADIDRLAAGLARQAAVPA